MSPLAYSEVEESADGGSKTPGMVIVEPTFVLSSKVDEQFDIKPYLDRRPRWGFIWSLGYSSYTPENVEPDTSIYSYDDVYGSPSTPLLEGQMGIKRNMSMGSLALEFGAGFFEAKGDPSLSDSKLNLIPIRLGATFILDTFSREPFIAPYASVGGYVIYYKETLAATSLNGTTQMAPYYSLGLNLQLDWIDRYASRVAFERSGVQNSFIYVELRQFLASASASDPDYGSSINYGGGLRVEF